MSYIGNQPTSVAFLTDTFSGNASATTFTLSAAPATTSSIIVAVSGVLQDPSTYAVAGTTLTFSAAPPTGTSNISVRFLGIPASGVTTTAYRTVTEFTATAGQTTFSVPSYTVGYIDVFRNGVLLGSADFVATNGTTVILNNGASAGDLIETISFFVSSVINAIPAVAGAVNSSYIANDVTINFADGSASTPSITNNGNTNTGIFFPAADTIAFSNGSTERMRINANGLITTPNQPMFLGLPLTDYSGGGMPAGLMAVTSIHNNGGYFNPANSRFTAPVTGWYLTTWGGLQLTATVTSLMINGVRTYNGNHFPSAVPYITVTQTAIVNLNAGDYLNIEQWNGGGYYKDWYLWSVTLLG